MYKVTGCTVINPVPHVWIWPVWQQQKERRPVTFPTVRLKEPVAKTALQIVRCVMEDRQSVADHLLQGGCCCPSCVMITPVWSFPFFLSFGVCSYIFKLFPATGNCHIFLSRPQLICCTSSTSALQCWYFFSIFHTKIFTYFHVTVVWDGCTYFILYRRWAGNGRIHQWTESRGHDYLLCLFLCEVRVSSCYTSTRVC